MELSTAQNDTTSMHPDEGSVYKVYGFAIICFISTLCAGLGSVTLLSLIKRWVNMTVINSISIGVFGCLVLAHFVPELIEHEIDYKIKYIPSDFHHLQIGAPIVFFGLCLMCAVDSIAHSFGEEHGEEDNHGAQVEHKRKSASGVFVFVMALHSFLEGIPVGVETKTFWTTSISLGLHKLLEAVTVAATLMHSTQRSFISLGVYAAMTPMGAVVGVFVATIEGQLADSATLFLVALSVGLMFYICFTELLNEVKESEECAMWFKLVVMIGSFTLISGFSAWTEHAFKKDE